MGKRVVGCIGIVVAAVLLCLGIFTKVPQKEISFFNFDGTGYTEYVGGDAYNIQIEAALRGGEIAGGKTARAVYISCASIVFIFSLSLITHTKQERASIPAVNSQNENVEQEKKATVSSDQSESNRLECEGLSVK